MFVCLINYYKDINLEFYIYLIDLFVQIIEFINIIFMLLIY